jgi:hypothetical protein
LATDKTRATWFEAERLAIADVSTLYYCAKSGTAGGDVNREPETVVPQSRLLHRPHHVSMHGRFLPVLAGGFGTDRRPAMIQRRVSEGSMTLSISNTDAIETALPLA